MSDQESNPNGWLGTMVLLTLALLLCLAGSWHLVFPRSVQNQARRERSNGFPKKLPLINVPVGVDSALFIPITRAVGVVYLVAGLFILFVLYEASR